MVKRKIVCVGLDFDGVVAYNPARIIRAPMTFIKRRIFGVKKLKFFVPKQPWQRWMWVLVHESSIFPARGIGLLRTLADSGQFEFHLVTARFDFLNQNLQDWLERYQLNGIFKTVTINAKNEQPHLFKERIIAEKKFDFFVEDNLDIVSYLDSSTRIKNTTVCWIYNFIDTFLQKHRPGFGYLEEALKWIVAQKG